MSKHRTVLLGLAMLLGNWVLSAEPPAGYVVQWGGFSSSNAFLGFSTGLVSVANAPLSDIIQVATGRSHGLALRKNGLVVGWGFDYRGQAAVPAGLSNVIAICAGPNDFSVALRNDGRVVVWGRNSFGQTNVPAGLSNVVQISAGAAQIIVRTREGTVVTWPGYDSTTATLSNVVTIAAGGGYYERSMAVTKDGRIVQLFSKYELPPADLDQVTSIAVGANHALALKSDGTVFGWGANGSGQATGVPTGTAELGGSGLVSLNGEVLRDVAAVAASFSYSLALKKDGTVLGWGDRAKPQRQVPAGLSNVVAIAAGEQFCLAITTNAAVAERFRR